MAELYIGMKIEAAEADLTVLEAYLASTQGLTFKQTADILAKVTKITILKVEKTTMPVETINETVLYETPTP